MDQLSTIIFTEERLQQMMFEVAQKASQQAIDSFVSTNLDSLIANKHKSSSSEEDSDMARQKFKVSLPDGTPVWVTGDTVSEAFNNFANKYGKPSPSTTDQQSSLTVRKFVNETYRPTYINNLAPTTIENYNQYLDLNILPFFGEMSIATVTVADVQNFYHWMASAKDHGRKKNINEASIKRISALAERIFKVALELDLITKTPFKHSLLTIRAEKASHHKALPDAEIDRVKKEIPFLESDDQRAYMGFLAYTDMRKEEILGIHWEDINLDEQFCSIEWTVTYPDNNKPVVRHETKTESSTRISLLPTPLICILRPLQKASGFVFGGENAWCYSKANRTFNRARKALNIVKYDNHDFRTTQATQRSEAGMDNKANADLMGHADTRMVETVYARRRKEGIMKQLATIEAMNAEYTKMHLEMQD